MSWLKSLLLTLVIVSTLVYPFYSASSDYSVSIDSKGYLWEGNIVNPWYFIGPSPMPYHFAEIVVDSLELAQKGYLITFAPSYSVEEVIVVKDSRKLYTALITITDDVLKGNFPIDLLVTPSKFVLPVSGVTKFGEELSSIIKTAIEGM